MIPRQWHVYIVDLEPRVGTKPGKQRPCVTIQPTLFAQSGLESTVVLPLTTRTVGEEAFPLRVRIPTGVAGVSQDSDVLIDQILAWDNTLFRRELGAVPEALQQDIKAALREFLEL